MKMSRFPSQENGASLLLSVVQSMVPAIYCALASKDAFTTNSSLYPNTKKDFEIMLLLNRKRKIVEIVDQLLLEVLQ